MTVTGKGILKKALPLLFFLLCVFFLAGCSKLTENRVSDQEQSVTQKEITDPGEPISRDLFAMDTFMTLTVYGEDAQDALDAAEAEISRLDELLSTGMEDSEISQLNRNGETILSDDPAYLYERSLEVNKMTDGAFDPMIYPLMEAWGFTTREYAVPDQEMLLRLLDLTDLSDVSYSPEDHHIVFEKEGMAIDFGGIAKGYTSASVIDILKEKGIGHAVISLGGNVQVLGTKPDGTLWKVAIRDPQNISGFIGIAQVSDKAVITSGGYERFFEENGKIYHHILDPSTGYPAENGLLSVTVISEDGTLADALSTALYVMGLEPAEQVWRDNRDLFDAVFVTDSGKLYITEGIRDSFLTDYYPVNIIRQ